MRVTTVFFDLDGTLTEPGLGITNSIMYAMKQLGMVVPPRQELYRFIGPPLLEEFQTVYGVSQETSEEMLRHFRTYFGTRGIFENSLYDGVQEMLQSLRSSGCRLILATSKPELFAEQVLEHFDLRHFFDIVAGSTMDEKRTAKAEVIAYAIGRAGDVDQARSVMVGDRSHDVYGGRANGMDTIGVLYGYGSREELCDAGAAYLAQTVPEIAELIRRIQ